jgi:hypothetical protein
MMVDHYAEVVAAIAAGDPDNWDMVNEELQTIKPGEWLGGSIMDFVLLTHWLYTRKQAILYLLNVSMVTLIKHGLDEELVKICRARLGLPQHGQLILKPVVAVIIHENHYFVTIFDYSSNRAHVIGRNITREGFQENVVWDDWDGSRIWDCVAELFGWHACPANSVEKTGIDWLQVCSRDLSWIWLI